MSDKCIYLTLSDNTEVQEEEIELADGKKAKIIWKDLLVEGTYPMSPSKSGAIPEPMTVIADGESDGSKKIISFSDLEFAHADGAFKYVTIPTRHKDELLDNTGYVLPRNPGSAINETFKGLRRVTKNGKQVLQSALGFTEPDIKGKVERGTIPDVSAGVFFNWMNKHKKKRYRAAIKHVALSGVPFMGNLDGFDSVFASDDDFDSDVVTEAYHFDDASTEEDSTATGEIVWDETKGASWLRQQLQSALRPTPREVDTPGVPYQPQPYYYVQDHSFDKALVEEEYKGSTTRFVIPFKASNDGVELSPQTRWVEVKEAMIAASDDEIVTKEIESKLSIHLSEDFEGFNLSLEGVTLDRHARIKNTDTESEFMASFEMFGDDVRIIPADRWVVVKQGESKKEEEEDKQQQQVKITMSDTTRAVELSPLELARKRRRQLVAS